MGKTLRVVSLFSGCGGGDLGLTGNFSFLGKHYDKLPFEIVFANDVYEEAARTHELNFGYTVSTSDISTVHSSEIPDHDLLIGGFPCQAFSVVGLRNGLKDPRGRLFYEMVRVLKDKTPAVFIAENVKGLISIDKGNVYNLIKDQFRKVGYELTDMVLNSADYGVPQKRERVIIVGVRSDLGVKFKMPMRTHDKNGKPFRKWVGLNKVIDKLEHPNPRYIFSERAYLGMKRANQTFNKGRAQDLCMPCNTISTHLAKVSLNGTDPVLKIGPKKYRRFSPREAASIQSFPKSFKFVGNERHQYVQIGNAIPPVLMWHIGQAVAEQVFLE